MGGHCCVIPEKPRWSPPTLLFGGLSRASMPGNYVGARARSLFLSVACNTVFILPERRQPTRAKLKQNLLCRPGASAWKSSPHRLLRSSNISAAWNISGFTPEGCRQRARWPSWTPHLLNYPLGANDRTPGGLRRRLPLKCQ